MFGKITVDFQLLTTPLLTHTKKRKKKEKKIIFDEGLFIYIEITGDLRQNSVILEILFHDFGPLASLQIIKDTS